VLTKVTSNAIALPACQGIKCAAVGAFTINSDKTRWLFHGWDVDLAQGPPDKIVNLVMASHPTKGQMT